MRLIGGFDLERDAVVALVVVECPKSAGATAVLSEQMARRMPQLDGLEVVKSRDEGALVVSLGLSPVLTSRALELVGWVASVVVEAEAASGVVFEVEIQTEMEW